MTNDATRLRAELVSVENEIQSCRHKVEDMQQHIEDLNDRLNAEQDDTSYGWLELQEAESELSAQLCRLRDLTEYKNGVLDSMEDRGITP